MASTPPRDREIAASLYSQDRKALIGALVLIVALFLVDRATSDPDRDGIALAELAGIGMASTSPPSPESPGPDGLLTAGGRSLLPLSDAAGAGGSLAGYVGQPAQGSGLTVLSVPADEGFWVGTGDTDRVWVQLIGAGESPYVVRAGDTVSFAGVVVGHGGDFAARVCVGTNQGSDLLTAQAAHIEVPMDDLVLRK